jgi:hypothetical protein
MYLQAACENVARFLTTFTADIAPPLRIERRYMSNIPRRAPHAKKFAFETGYPFAQIDDYRNAFVHWPRLGRNPRLPWEVISRYEELSLAALSWSHVQGLSEKNFINGRGIPTESSNRSTSISQWYLEAGEVCFGFSQREPGVSRVLRTGRSRECKG